MPPASRRRNQYIDPGYVYCATSAAHRHLVKIGITVHDVEERLQSLSRPTGVPKDFILAWQTGFIPNPYQVEQTVHELFHRELRRPSGLAREFHMTSVEQARETIQKVIDGAIPLDSVVSSRRNQHADVEVQRTRRPPIPFSDYGIPEGGELKFVGHPNIAAYVHGEWEVLLDETPYSVSKAAQLVRGTTADAFRKWTYNGRTLWDLFEDYYAAMENDLA